MEIFKNGTTQKSIIHHYSLRFHQTKDFDNQNFEMNFFPQSLVKEFLDFLYIKQSHSYIIIYLFIHRFAQISSFIFVIVKGKKRLVPNGAITEDQRKIAKR